MPRVRAVQPPMTRCSLLTMLPMMALLTLPACKEEEPEKAQQGDACNPNATGDDAEQCDDGLSCEPLGTTGDQYVCGAPLQIRGRVIDALDESPIAGALVSALDESGAPVTDVAESDADGHYVLHVSARRDENGEIADALKWTLNCGADEYVYFPSGIRPAIPVDAQDAVEEGASDTDGDNGVQHVIENATTTIAMIPLPDDQAGGATITGSAGGETGAGALVVAEGVGSPGSRAIADQAGQYTLFNVPVGEATVRAYRVGVEFEPASVMTADGETHQVDLTVATDNPDDLALVSGSVNIVNAPGGSMTSVVLVPVSVYNEVLERGAVPFGLRAPTPPEAPSITSAFEIPGVPAGTYKVLAAFENDELVRDPDESIAGTAIQEITVSAGTDLTLEESFKITEALDVVGPGANAPERVTSAPTLIWADDSSEDRYEVVVYNALGDLVWEDLNVPGVSGSDTVEVPYGGPALEPGMYYQFRATSFKDTPQGSPAISRTEDLRGVFVFGEEPAATTGG